MSSNQLVSVNQELGYFTTWRCGEEMVVMQLYAVNAPPCVCVCVCLESYIAVLLSEKQYPDALHVGAPV